MNKKPEIGTRVLTKGLPKEHIGRVKAVSGLEEQALIQTENSLGIPAIWLGWIDWADITPAPLPEKKEEKHDQKHEKDDTSQKARKEK